MASERDLIRRTKGVFFFYVWYGTVCPAEDTAVPKARHKVAGRASTWPRGGTARPARCALAAVTFCRLNHQEKPICSPPRPMHLGTAARGWREVGRPLPGRVFPSSSGSLSRQFGGVPGEASCVSQSGRTTYPDGSPSPPRARAALVRTGWPETAVGPPAAPRPRRICTSGAAPAHAGARSSAPGGSVPVVPRGGRSRRAAWTGGPLPGGCARGSPSGRGFRRAGWPGPPRGCAGGAPPALHGAARRGGAVRGHFTFQEASPTIGCVFCLLNRIFFLGLSKDALR